MWGNARRLKFSSLGSKTKVQFIISIYSIDMCFILESKVRVERHNIEVYVMGSISIEFKIDYYGKL
jgi:hypothetical protein